MDCFKKADVRKKPPPDMLFTDVYDEMPKHIRKQYEEMKSHVNKYPQNYPLEQYEKMKNVWCHNCLPKNSGN